MAAAQTQKQVSGPISETVTIAAGEWRAYVATLGSSDSFKYSVQVTQGADIDVYMVDAAGYADYTSPSAPTFNYFVSGTLENTQTFSKTFSVPRAGTYYMVVDNAPITSAGAPGSSAVTVSVTAEVPQVPVLTIVLILVIVVAAAVVLIVVLRSRRKKAMATLPPTQPPMQPPWPPQQPPMPPEQPPLP